MNNTGARFRLRTGGVLHVVEIPPSSLFSGAWYHLAATYDGTTIRLYLNGSLTAFGSATGSIGYHPDAPATLGNGKTFSTPFFGAIDDVRIYGTALSDLEVIDLVIGDVSTGIEEQRLRLTPQGRLHLPLGTWTHMDVYDASGRCAVRRALSAGTPDVAWADVPTGPYLVCLQGNGRSYVQRVLVP